MTIPCYSERYYLHEFCGKYHRMGTKAEKKCYDKEKLKSPQSPSQNKTDGEGK